MCSRCKEGKTGTRKEGSHISHQPPSPWTCSAFSWWRRVSLPWDCCFLLSGDGWGLVFCHMLQGPDCGGRRHTALAFVKRRRRLTAPGSGDNSGGRKEPPWGVRDSLCGGMEWPQKCPLEAYLTRHQHWSSQDRSLAPCFNQMELEGF